MKISSRLKGLFTAPRYISFPAIGVDISDRFIKFVGFKKTAHGLRVSFFGSHELPVGVVSKGQIINQQKLIENLKIAKADFVGSWVNVSLPEEQAYVFSTTVPVMKADEIRDSLSLQMERFVPIPLKDIIFDFEVVSISKNSYVIQVVAIDRKTVYQYLDIFHSADLKISLFEIEPQSIARALLTKDNNETVMLVDFGDSRTGVSIISGGYIMFTTTSEVVGNNFEEVFKNDLQVPVDKLRSYKVKYGLVEHPETASVNNSLQKLANNLSKDLQKTLQYWQSENIGTNSGKVIRKIILCGGNSEMPGLIPVLQSSLLVPVEKGNPWARVVNSENEYVPMIPSHEALRYTSAIGLSIASFDI